MIATVPQLNNGTWPLAQLLRAFPTLHFALMQAQVRHILTKRKIAADTCPDPTNGTPMKIWKCFDGLAAQKWFVTDDDRIALENQGKLIECAPHEALLDNCTPRFLPGPDQRRPHKHERCSDLALH
jgi:hypothetical protein